MTATRHILFALLLLLIGSSAKAHLTPNSEVKLDVAGATITADIIIPASEYAYASGNPVDDTASEREQARQYLKHRFTISSGDGTRWTARISKVNFGQTQGPPDLLAEAVFRAPPGADQRNFRIGWSAVVDEVPDHFALFVLRDDFAGRFGGDGRILGIARQSQTSIDVTLDAPSKVITMANAAKLGMGHILSGPDHLTFLLMLLLVAPLSAKGARWTSSNAAGAAIRKVVGVVTGFTVGHTITLSGAVIGNWNLPSAPVEIVIAISVLVTAVHALRPIFPGREMIVSSGFGLIHGFGFAGFILELDPDLSTNYLTLAGFNIGIEMIQLALVAVIAPVFIYLASRRQFRWPRILMAAATIVLSCFWIFERTIDVA